MKHLLSLSALLSLAACATTRAPGIEPLKDVSEVPVRYSSRLSGAAGISRIAGPPGRAEPAERSDAEKPEPSGGLLVQVHCKLVEVHREDALSMLGAGLRGRLASQAVAERALETLEQGGRSTLITAPALTLLDGSQGDIQVMKDHAFVEAFEFTRAPDDPGIEGATIGDPVVATVFEGVQVEAKAQVMADGTSVRLEIGVCTTEILDSIPEKTARIPGSDAAVTVQQPLCFTQHASASAELASDCVLMIGGLPTGDPSRVIVALVSARVAAPERDSWVGAAAPAGAR